ncbi:MAG TPA: hypothetical protein VIU64_07310, partial [Polyangia bacterium]
MTNGTSSRLFTAPRARLLRAALVAAATAASCNADLVVGVLGRGPHDGSGASDGGYVTGSGGHVVVASGGNWGTGGPVASGGVTGTGGSGPSVIGLPVPITGSCDAQLALPMEGTNRCARTSGVAFSPDGLTLAAGQASPTPNVHLWSLPSGARLRDVTGAGTVTYDVAFSPDGRLLATASDSTGSGTLTAVTPGIVNLWDVATGALVMNIPATCGVYADSVAFSPDGELLATGGIVGPIELWRVTTG